LGDRRRLLEVPVVHLVDQPCVGPEAGATARLAHTPEPTVRPHPYPVSSHGSGGPAGGAGRRRSARGPLGSGPMAAQFIYTMRKLSRFYPPDRQVLEDISLSFLPGAKIGVLGANGAGK